MDLLFAPRFICHNVPTTGVMGHVLEIITDRVRSTREGYVLTRVCPSVCLSTPGRGYPGQVQPGGVPQPGPGEGTTARSRYGGTPMGGTQIGGTPTGGTLPWVPPIRPGRGYPTLGIPPVRPGQGVPHLRYPH